LSHKPHIAHRPSACININWSHATEDDGARRAYAYKLVGIWAYTYKSSQAYSVRDGRAYLARDGHVGKRVVIMQNCRMGTILAVIIKTADRK